MKILVLLLLVSAKTYQCTEIESYSSIREIIERFLDSLRDILPDELPLRDRDIPGPGNSIVSTNGTLYNGFLGGLKYFRANIQYSGILVPVPTGATIYYDLTSIRSDYISRLGISFLPQSRFENEGKLLSIVKNTVLQAEVEFSLATLSLQLRNLKLEVGELEVELEGLLGSKLLSRWVSSLLTNYGADLINLNQEYLAPVITDVINDFLAINFPRVFVENENVDHSTYTREELDARASILEARLNDIILQLKSILS